MDGLEFRIDLEWPRPYLMGRRGRSEILYSHIKIMKALDIKIVNNFTVYSIPTILPLY